MLSTTARRTYSLYSKAHLAQALPLRLLSIVPSSNTTTLKGEYDRRQIHSSRSQEQDAVAEASSVAPSSTTEVAQVSGMTKRFTVMVEATVSKIFPAGFCWQTASIVAGSQGYATDSLSFALTTGVGDALGVFGGHCLYYAGKKGIMGESSGINLTKELHAGLLLGTAAFCSGTVWQPIVNALQGANLPFNQVFFGTWLGCGAAFYLGLRVGRTILSGPCEYIHEPTYENSKKDISLSVAVGGATGFFVGTDAAYLPQQNFLIGYVGIQPGVPDLTGCAIAGTSTSLGFLTSQTAMNLAYPAGKLWND